MTAAVPVRVGIAGAGSVALATAALLDEAGHRAGLWSPSGASTAPLETADLKAEGACEHTCRPTVHSSAGALCEASDVVLIALPAYGHRQVMEAIAAHLRPGQAVIISSHASFGALYLSKLLAERGVALPIVAWGTTVATARKRSPTQVAVNTVRAKVDLATVPASAEAEGMALCEKLFGERFVPRGGLMAIQLSNLNPQNHMGIALCNMTRMEHGESWSQGANVTPNVGRLLEALDAERLAIAAALGLQTKTIFEHFSRSFHVAEASVAEMNAEMAREGRGGQGPATADSRYVTEDAPYGLAVTAALGELTGHPAPLHAAGVAIFSALYGRDFRAENDLLPGLDFCQLDLTALLLLCREGYAAHWRHETRNDASTKLAAP